MKNLVLHLLFFIIVAGDLVGEYLQNSQINHVFKPFIMIWIGVYFLIYSKNIDRKIVQMGVLAFTFSWIGDLCMMFSGEFLFFVAAIIAFLAAQLFYIFLFLRTIHLSGKRPYLKKNPFWLLAYLAYGIIMYILFFPHLSDVLRVAVFIYIGAILTMSATALNRYGNGHPVSFTLVFAGSLLFVVSDSVIAVNRFLLAVPFEGLLVMTTYIGAQYLIMRGLLMQYN